MRRAARIVRAWRWPGSGRRRGRSGRRDPDARSPGRGVPGGGGSPLVAGEPLLLLPQQRRRRTGALRGVAPGLRVPAEALADTTALAEPAGRLGPQRRRRPVQRQAAGAGGLHGGAGAPPRGPARSAIARPCARAAERLARDQAADGSWTLEGDESPGSPAAYGRSLATFLAREGLAAADAGPFPRRHRPGRRLAAAARDRQRRRRLGRPDGRGTVAIAVIGRAAASGARTGSGRGQSDDGGWGPYVTSPPEPFDTALALLGLARSGDSSDPARRMIARGRALPDRRPAATTGAGPRRRGRPAARAMPSGSRRPAGRPWPCWRPARRRLGEERSGGLEGQCASGSVSASAAAAQPLAATAMNWSLP